MAVIPTDHLVHNGLEGPGADYLRPRLLTTYDLDEYVYGALRAGASGFLLKDSSGNN
jgi:hypothetical protein